MACIPFGSGAVKGFICGLPDYQTYICLEHTTYLFEFQKMFGPAFWRIECGKEIEVEIEFNDDNECISNEFLWDIFEEMKMPPNQEKTTKACCCPQASLCEFFDLDENCQYGGI